MMESNKQMFWFKKDLPWFLCIVLGFRAAKSEVQRHGWRGSAGPIPKISKRQKPPEVFFLRRTVGCFWLKIYWKV